ncbi:MAG: winged helix-turn-helix domain-containing protein [Gemmatimonadales bacterium]|nr:winged helix-turn-helix domain-containing protein [Gemmatimonadales bacterium]MYG49511.1 winged helix-turn-helix domain-containing protein [Gemmatimonadales bacterium]MYK01873.1 winged helix-turn-helix domain-containing protein [Candidatus Palauibacter ramosifaciens]
MRRGDVTGSGRRRPTFSREAATRLWLRRQGLDRPRRSSPLDPAAFVDHLERTGALQLDSVNVVDRAHYLTLWSRFGSYDRADVDRWVYGDRLAYEYWGHEASILPISHLPLGRRRMRRFPPESWSGRAWWSRYATSTASKRRVLRRLRAEGPLESVDFQPQPAEREEKTDSLAWRLKEDKRSLKLLWHDGRVAVAERRHFRCVYDLAERIYPEGSAATLAEYYDSWLLVGLSGCGIAPERHLVNYFTGPELNAAERRRTIARNLRRKRIVEVEVDGLKGPCYALPEHLDAIERLPDPEGTTLICPFDSLLWQRKRAAELLDFHYTIEIYVPAKKRRYGYYVLPILHDGRLVGRLDPKLHRDRSVLEIRALHFEPDFARTARFETALGDAVADLADFLGADDIVMPPNG